MMRAKRNVPNLLGKKKKKSVVIQQMAMTTTTIFNIIRSELIKKGHSEFERDTPQTDVFPFGEFVFYDEKYQFTEKILRYDEDVSDIIDYIFSGIFLNKEEYYKHFTKGFLSYLFNITIKRQTA